MIQNEIVRGCDFSTERVNDCETCIQAKKTRGTFKETHRNRAKRILDLIHVDLIGPMKPKSLGGNEDVLVIIDDHSRRVTVEFMKSKDKTEQRLINFIKRAENEIGRRVRAMRSDNGGEFMSNNLRN